MARKQVFLDARFSDRFKSSYARLGSQNQAACDRAVIALLKRQATSGLRVKPIQPDKYYLEARMNSGDRIVFRVSEETVLFIDVVNHDDIGRYGRRPVKTKK
jgi:hypothetical protein